MQRRDTQNPDEAPRIDPRYYSAGATWEDETHRNLRRSRTFAWLLTGASFLVAIASLFALVMLMPLKQFEPYMIEVDRTTGYLEVARALKPGDLSQNEAVTAANIVRYVRARETYDPKQLKYNFDLAQLLSAGAAANDLRSEFSPGNPSSKDKVYGADTQIAVSVKSLSFLNKSTATVRFSTDEKRDNSISRQHWVSVVKFQFTNAPLKNEYRFDNPLGFQVVEYRRDQESLPAAGGAGQ
ncbi:type VI secretion protein [Paramesorhizobium deserti]|uniref:Type IV secretion system protein virB8 n=1 Tax=Paramesorhizobium deserti TaxID=1494590 RepID=A0A135HTJ0_9HYPH|nr:VirB8/TrbF family protein [Paramesorhizobium deserti]KXF76488.1 type VI secretion protein [Paramesorhizobium deserti]